MTGLVITAATAWVSMLLAANQLQVPEYSTAGMPEAVSSYFERAVEEIAETDLSGNGDELAMAYGRLGQLFLAYALNGQAEESFRRAGQLQPQQAAWSYLRAVAATRVGDAETAVAGFQQALAARPDYYAATVKLCAIYRDLGLFEDADRVLSRLPTDEDAPASILAALGEHLLAVEQPDRAVGPLKAALERQPEATRLHYLLGQAYRSLGDRKLARFHLSQAGEVGLALPDPYLDSVAKLGRSEVLMLQSGQKAFMAGDYAGAARAFEDALRIEPDSVRARINLASALGELGDARRAMDLFADVLRLQPDNATVLYNLARLEVSAGELAAASSRYERLAVVAPDDAAAAWEHARVLQALNKPDAALEKLTQAKNNPEFYRRAVLFEAEILVQLNRAPEALAELENAIGLLPRDLEIVITLANLLSITPGELRDPQRALQLAQDAFTAYPSSSAAAEAVGLALTASNQCEEAITWLQRAATLSDDGNNRERLLSIAQGLASEDSCMP